MAGQEYKFPAFDDLPKVKDMPQGSIWGFFDKDGEKDEVGSKVAPTRSNTCTSNCLTAINLLTSDVVKAASKEISTGEHIQLDWELHNVQFPGFNRKELEQKQIDFANFSEFCANDDELHINTQAGSQWDSLKHFAHQASGMYYNGLSHKEAAKSVTNGTHKWCERGGIVGRGVLCDWLSWYEEKNGKAPSAVSRHEIPIDEIEETLKWQGTTVKQGDIMMIRSGYVRWHKYVALLDAQLVRYD
jgi:hypothetical protein